MINRGGGLLLHDADSMCDGWRAGVQSRPNRTVGSRNVLAVKGSDSSFPGVESQVPGRTSFLSRHLLCSHTQSSPGRQLNCTEVRTHCSVLSGGVRRFWTLAGLLSKARSRGPATINASSLSSR